jgi:hypothetical protein
MKRYTVTIPVFCSIQIKVEARSKKHALSKALNEALPPTICYQCSKYLEVGEINVDGACLDGVEQD